MTKLLNILSKGLAGILFIALLAINVQVGNGSNGIGETNLKSAKAAPCDLAQDICKITKFPGESPVPTIGQSIIVTPE